MKSSSAGEGSKSLSGFFNRSVTLSDLQADPRRNVGDLGSRRLQPTAEPIPEALFGFDGQAWDAGQYAREGPDSKGRYDAFVRNTTLPTVKREKARRLARPGESPGKLLGRLRRAKQPRESEILDHNLRTIGHVPVASERPNIRKSALRLERRYRSAMAVVDGRDPAALARAAALRRRDARLPPAPEGALRAGRPRPHARAHDPAPPRARRGRAAGRRARALRRRADAV